jgi:hypothetical protein
MGFIPPCAHPGKAPSFLNIYVTKPKLALGFPGRPCYRRFMFSLLPLSIYYLQKMTIFITKCNKKPVIFPCGDMEGYPGFSSHLIGHRDEK